MLNTPPDESGQLNPKINKVCQFCGSKTHLLRAALVRPDLAGEMTVSQGRFDSEGWICETDLNAARSRYIQGILKAEKGEITHLEREVLESLRDHELVAQNPDSGSTTPRTLGEVWADRIATFGGSWTFILIFGAVIVVWMLCNTFLLMTKAFDPFPYILLNLVLSCLAALQAPVIMMSQRRQESRDRNRAENDYKINLKAELEIRHLHQKIDHLLTSQWSRLIEIQNVQVELMEEVRQRQRRPNGTDLGENSKAIRP